MIGGHQQEVPLPGAYYGPPVPPQAPYHASQRRWCNLLRCLLWTIILLGFAFAVTVLIVWLVYRPTKIKVAVETATLSNFNLTSSPSGGNILSYNMTANVTIRNPNRKVGVYYDWLEADSYYRDARFDWTPLPTFFQGHKNSTALQLAIDGNNTVVDFGSLEVEGYKSDVKNGGSFNINLWINGRVRYKYGSAVTRRYTLRVRCPLTVMLKAPETKAFTMFVRTECDVVKF